MEHLPSMVAGVWSEDGSLQLVATTQFRKLLSVGEKLLLGVCVIIIYPICITCFCCQFLLPERSPPIEEVIQAGVVPRFVQFLMREDFPQLQVSWMPLTVPVFQFFLWLCIPKNSNR